MTGGLFERGGGLNRGFTVYHGYKANQISGIASYNDPVFNNNSNKHTALIVHVHCSNSSLTH